MIIENIKDSICNAQKIGLALLCRCQDCLDIQEYKPDEQCPECDDESDLEDEGYDRMRNEKC